MYFHNITIMARHCHLRAFSDTFYRVEAEPPHAADEGRSLNMLCFNHLRCLRRASKVSFRLTFNSIPLYNKLVKTWIMEATRCWEAKETGVCGVARFDRSDETGKVNCLKHMKSGRPIRSARY
jgi:hypothetical protein